MTALAALLGSIRGWLIVGLIAAIVAASWWGVREIERGGYERARREDALAREKANERIRELERFNAAAGRVVETRYVQRTRQLELDAQQREALAHDYIRTHPDSFTCAVDADGLRLWNGANAGESAVQPAPQPDRAVPAAPARSRWPFRDAVHESPAGHEVRANVPGASRRVVGVGERELLVGQP
jgi:hypothetical protein